MMLDALKRLFRSVAPPAAPPDTIVVDQNAYYTSLAVRHRRWREDEDENERQRLRVAFIIWEWARDVVRYRCKRPLPAKLPRTGSVRDWMDGLTVQEIFTLARADGCSIKQHVYENALITGVRRVQNLTPAVLMFPAPKIAQDDETGRIAGGGGGPKRRSR